MNFPDYYGVLGLPRFYPTQEEIRDAFLKKVVELNASGEADPDARQALDSAYVTLSDAQKKRQYDEVLDRYVQAEETFAPKSDTPEKVVISAYDYKDNYTEKRTVSMSPLSKQIYDFLCDKVRELTEISSRYPFTSKSDIEQNWFFEISMLILYTAFSMAYLEEYSKYEMMQFWDDGISLISLGYPVEVSEKKAQELTVKIGFMINEFLRGDQFSEDDLIFDYMANIYIVHTSSGNDIGQKIERPDFFEAFLSMQREVSEFWKRFFREKEFVT